MDKYQVCELYMIYIIIPGQRMAVKLQNHNTDETLKNTYSLVWITMT